LPAQFFDLVKSLIFYGLLKYIKIRQNAAILVHKLTEGITLDTILFYGKVIILKRRNVQAASHLDGLSSESKTCKVSLVFCCEHFKPDYLAQRQHLKESKGFGGVRCTFN